MMISGYGHKYRWEIINGAIKRYDELVKERPLGIHRNGKEIREATKAKSGGGSDN